MTPKFTPLTWTDIIKYLYQNRTALIVIPFSVAVLVLIFTLFISNRYTATANLLPSQRPSLGFDLFSEDGGLSSIASSVLGNETNMESNRYIILLSSYSTSTKVIEKFDLLERYEVTESKAPYTNAIDILSERTTFESQEEGNFIISVEAETPELAKEMTTFYVDVLNQENTRIATKDAKQYREFIERRYEQVENDIDSLQTKIIAFQNRYGIFELPEQAKEYFSLIGALTAKEVEAEVKLQLLSQTVQPKSDTYKTAEIELNAIRNSLTRFYNDTDSSNIVLNFGSLSELGAKYFRLYLEVEIQTEIAKFLRPIYEQAKMEEVKSLPIVTVVDAPVIPEKKSYPKRSLIIISAGLSAGILLCLYFILRLNYIRNKEYFEFLKG
ncbi:MAG: hypothetical protein JJ971_02750 [Balneolaceae bacterium]|nr:hypothetical protein [Balneolaceae bacterium]MBO6545289.1 hypothetical protein [Balneolaceae bacterium]MBO6646685.1 hypothetical protein [Balneolaceae bacterium]